MGDDDVDIPDFARVGLAAAVADADPSVHTHVHLYTKATVGRGAVREFINFILKSRGQLPVP
jgi:3-deoxy-D-manno-octulosonate 8-phosphate phosphatase (KDO 8-P phosphatase)